MRRRKRRKQRKIIIISFISVLFIITVGYAAFQTNINITAKGNIIEKSRVIKARDNTAFWSEQYRINIVTATFLDTNKVPSNVIESWDVSKANDRGVMAYITTNTNDTTKYDLYIGANKGVIANENSGSLFSGFINLISIDFGVNFDTSKTTNMGGMFYNDKSLNSLDLSNFDTNEVTNMSVMFGMYGYRNDTTSLTTLNLSSFNTNKVTDMHDMFSYNPNLKNIIGIEKFDTRSVTSMYGMFHSCKSITVLNLCSFNTNKAIRMQDLFQGTTNLSKVLVGPNWTTANAYTDNMWLNSKISSVTKGQC